MYNAELWNGCLSFIQMSVALNIGCILVKVMLPKTVGGILKKESKID